MRESIRRRAPLEPASGSSLWLTPSAIGAPFGGGLLERVGLPTPGEISLDEKPNGRGVAVDEVGLPSRPYFAVAKKPRDWESPEVTPYRLRIMIGPAKQARPPPATEKRCAGERTDPLARLHGKLVFEFLACRCGVAELELEGLAYTWVGSQFDGAGFRVGSQNVSNHEVSRPEIIPVLVRSEAREQVAAHGALLPLGKPLD